jgi:hypothetical protein
VHDRIPRSLHLVPFEGLPELFVQVVHFQNLRGLILCRPESFCGKPCQEGRVRANARCPATSTTYRPRNSCPFHPVQPAILVIVKSKRPDCSPAVGPCCTLRPLRNLRVLCVPLWPLLSGLANPSVSPLFARFYS